MALVLGFCDPFFFSWGCSWCVGNSGIIIGVVLEVPGKKKNIYRYWEVTLKNREVLREG